MFSDLNSYTQYYGMNNGPFVNQGFNPGNLNNGFDFRTTGMTGFNSDELISFSQAVDMIRRAVGDERADEVFYDALIKMAPNDRDKEIITGIRDDERKHNRILRELYFNFTGQMIPVDSSNDSCESDFTYKDGLEKALFGELEAVVKYRRIMGVMPSGNSYILLMSIMTDELRHSAMYNYLIHMAK